MNTYNETAYKKIKPKTEVYVTAVEKVFKIYLKTVKASGSIISSKSIFHLQSFREGSVKWKEQWSQIQRNTSQRI